ncbi:D-alanyl-D-alanine carboxypeptidase family protein [Radiobacillus deserti]|uniref:D-alanyl-D-alanine carboxypeptidase n=1 Tax=Radiobacillus deserti TaxID=2594883 RepID=A0A516KL88_9BACI|nr:D-alanyl-D-alanine carboxypeptidase [Radiobacillus deserti]
MFALLVQPVQTFAKPGVSSRNAVLMEQTTGRVLYEKAANDQHLIASITKIMTAIVAIESGKLDETVTASRRAVYTEGSSIYLKEGEKMKLKDLVYGLMLRSGNDSAVAIAEHVGGSVEGFVHLMNEKAQWLGMTNSHFDNPHGLDSETHYSTAYDMALLMRHAMNNEIFREITSAKSYKAESREYAWGNKNKLLTRYYEYSTGGKTGYTKKAGRTLVSTAEKDGMKLIVVTLDGPDDWNDHMSLFDWGFKHYDMKKLQDEGIQTYSIQGSDEIVEGFIHHDILYPLTEQENKQLTSETFIEKETKREEPGGIIGKKIFRLNGETITSASIFSEAEQGEEKGFWDQVLSVFEQLTGASVHG